jgi:uncharacterized protein YjiS (DUF1127 family)
MRSVHTGFALTDLSAAKWASYLCCDTARKSTMSFYELERPGTTTSLSDRVFAPFAAMKRGADSLLQSLAYARMMSVMHRMDDATLAKIGITRDGIAAYVEKCLRK